MQNLISGTVLEYFYPKMINISLNIRSKSFIVKSPRIFSRERLYKFSVCLYVCVTENCCYSAASFMSAIIPFEHSLT
jgi:hypothetical protein